MTTSGLAGKPLTRPSANLSPSDGVRGVWSIPPLVFGNWSELTAGAGGPSSNCPAPAATRAGVPGNACPFLRQVPRPLPARRGSSCAPGWLNPADPLALFPHGFQRGQVPGVEHILRGGDEFAAAEIIPGVARADRHELQHARVAVAVDHAAGAAIANQLRGVDVIDVVHGRLTEVAAVEVQIPIEVEILVAAQAAELLRLFAQMTLHLVDRKSARLNSSHLGT